MKVKICGLGNETEAIAACAAGADYLGFVFYPPSPRYCEPEKVLTIKRALERNGWLAEGHPVMVGLTVNMELREMAELKRTAGVDCLQVYGEYDPADLARLPVDVFKAIRPASPVEALAEADRYASIGGHDGPALLMDAYIKGAWGGTGKKADWNLASQICTLHPRTLLAGGLTPQNVAGAIAQVQPWGVDVSSGVESAPGRKDLDAIQAFTARARKAGAELGLE